MSAALIARDEVQLGHERVKALSVAHECEVCFADAWDLYLHLKQSHIFFSVISHGLGDFVCHSALSERLWSNSRHGVQGQPLRLVFKSTVHGGPDQPSQPDHQRRSQKRT